MPFIKPRYFAALPAMLLCTNCIASKEPVGLQGKGSACMITIIQSDTLPPVADSTRTDAFIENLLQGYPRFFDSILANRKAYNIQVIYTKTDRGANGMAALKNYYFNVNSCRYFSPASAVELPISMLTLQRLNELKSTGIDKNTTMLTGAAFNKQTAVYNDPTTPEGKPTIAQYLKKMLVGNDKDANNRLYEFLGQEYINSQFRQKGYATAQVIQRLGTKLTEEENRHTNPVKFYAPGNKLLYQQAMQYNGKPYLQKNDLPGKAQQAGNKLVNQPENFAGNKITLEELHTLLISLVFPNKVTSSQRFNITDEDRKFILKYMSQLPGETLYPPYHDDTATYYPARNKFLLYGAERGTLPANIRIFNVAGIDQGQMIDVAYIVDLDKKIEFFLSAVINCSNDGVIQDDKYDCRPGLDFMKNLGQVIYDYETRREKKILPALAEVKFEYDRR